MKEYNGLESIIESEVDIYKKNPEDEEVKLLLAKNELLFKSVHEYNTPTLEIGKMCANYAHGEIFDAETIAEYEQVQHKIPIQPKILKPRINAIAGQIMQRKRNGKIIVEAGDSPIEANRVLKFFQDRIDEEHLLKQMLLTGCLTGCPQVLWFDLAESSYGDPIGGLTADVLPWDSFVCSPYQRPDGKDITNIFRIKLRTLRELKDENPNREDEITEFYAKHGSTGDNGEDYFTNTDGLTINDARYLNYNVLTGKHNTRLGGRVLCVERLSIAKTNIEVAFDRAKGSVRLVDEQIRPGTWSDAEWNAWKRENSNKYAFATKPIKILWHSRWTREGLMLQNKPHWFRENDAHGNPVLPCAVFTPQIIDGKPTAPGPDAMHLIFLNAVAETEALHDIRTGSGDVLAMLDGCVKNPETIPKELSIGNGVITLDQKMMQGRNIDNVLQFLKRTPNKSYLEYAEKVRYDLDQTDLINRNIRGERVPDQSGKSQQIEIAQVMTAYYGIAENYNKTFEQIKMLECMLIPYVMTQETIITINDDQHAQEDEQEPFIVNKKSYDINGNAVIDPATDLRSVNWRYRLVDGDDSPTAKQDELNEMLIFWNAAAPTLIKADESLATLASMLKSMPNKTAKEIGSIIERKAKIRAEEFSQQQRMQIMADVQEKAAKAEADRIKAMRAGFSFSLTGEDLVEYPQLFKFFVENGYLNTADNYRFRLPNNQQQEVVR